MVFLLRESRTAAERGLAPRRGRIGAILGTLRRPVLSRLILIFFLVILAFAAMESTFALWAMRQFRWGPEQVGYVFAYVGVLSAILQGGLIGRLAKRFGEERLLLGGLALIGLGLLALPFARDVPWLGIAVSGLALGIGLTQPSLNSLISRRAGREEQGEVLGVSQSVGSLSRVIGPALAGVAFADLGRDSPFLFGVVADRPRLRAGPPPVSRARRRPAGRGRARIAAGSGAMSRRGRPVTPGPPRQKGRLRDELRALRSLAPYLWPREAAGLRARVALAVAFMVAGRLVSISVPFLYKHAVDALTPAKAAIAVPVVLIVGYGLARVMAQGFQRIAHRGLRPGHPARGAPAVPVGVYPCP